MKIIFATTNLGKMVEAKAIGARYKVEFVQGNYEGFEIQSNDLEEIAVHCAGEAWEKLKKPLIVEDSGVFVDSLNGFPGPYSAYVFKTIGLDGVLKLMIGVKNRQAIMRSAVAYVDGKGIRTFTGEVKGVIADNRKGSAGFGYDPIFIPDGWKKTFGEDVNYKLKVSHRAQSLRKFCEWYSKK